MIKSRGMIIAFTLLTSQLVTACERPEKIARRVMAPLDSIAGNDLASLEAGYQESKIRLASVRNNELRTVLSDNVDQTYQRLVNQYRAAEQQRREQAQTAARRAAMRQAIIDLEGGMRISPIENQVLVLRNSRNFRLDFDLKCYTQDNSYSKTFFVSVPPRSSTEIGFVQGWEGNFKPGEHCEAHYQGELLWDRSVPPA